MPTKFKLSADPTFVMPVKIPVAGGDPFAIKFTFKHRTKKDYEAFTKEAAEKDMSDVDYTLAIAVGWELEEPFNEESLTTLFENRQGAATAISEVYSLELLGARRKN